VIKLGNKFIRRKIDLGSIWKKIDSGDIKGLSEKEVIILRKKNKLFKR